MQRVMDHFLFLASFAGSKVLGLELTIGMFKKWGTVQRRFFPMAKNASQEALKNRLKRGHAFLPFPIQCLDQAIVTWYLLNLHGHPAVLKIGAKLEPFTSHSWVQEGDTIFGEIATREDLHVVAEYGAWANGFGRPALTVGGRA